ncbi:MAG TPA: lactate racemase domain-containing protein [Planctomycetota bacterium]
MPPTVDLQPVACPVQAGPARSHADQTANVQAALDKPQSGPALKDLAKVHRRAVVLVGDLALPAPYELALPPVIEALKAGEIRPSRISVLAAPGGCGPLVGRGAIHRYGEEIAGDYELRAWQAGEQPDELFTAADFRIAIVPAGLPTPLLPPSAAGQKLDCVLHLDLGKNANLEIASATLDSTLETRPANPQSAIRNPQSVWLTTGGGSQWEATLEEALLSLWNAQPATTGVLAFSGDEGLGSAYFTHDLWSLLKQAEEVLASGGSLSGAGPLEAYDPAAVFAQALGTFERLVLLSPGLSEHEEGGDLAEQLAALPKLASHIELCADEKELWDLLAIWHSSTYRLAAEPLGWRANIL